MNIDWGSGDTEVLLNPRIEKEERELYTRLLKAHKMQPGHLWFTTSGTTGRFKFVALSREALLASASAVNAHLSATQQDTWINVLPTFHVGGLGVFARAFASGANVVNLYSEEARWDPRLYIKAVIDARATLSSLVPTQVFDLLKDNQKSPSTLRAVVVGGGALDESLLRKGRSLGWNLLPSYGLTECASQVATAEPEGGPFLKILSHIQADIDKEGYIHLKSASLLSGYATFQEGEMRFTDPKMNGWFKTEDLGSIEKGLIKVLGRNSDFIKVGGESVNLLAVQKNLDALKEGMSVEEELVLMSLKDERLGASIALCMEGEASLRIKNLVARYNEEALPYERIQKVVTVEKIPRNTMGKPLKDKMQELIRKSAKL